MFIQQMPGHSTDDLCRLNKFFGGDGAIARSELDLMLLRHGHIVMIRAYMRHIKVLLSAVNHCNKQLRWLKFWYVGPLDFCVRKLQEKVDVLLSVDDLYPRLGKEETSILIEALTLLGKKFPQMNYLDAKSKLNSIARTPQ